MTLCKWAIEQGYLDVNPAVGTTTPDKHIRPRERVLSAPELVAIWNGCDQPYAFDTIVKLLMLTGARRQEVGSMAHAELDRSTGIWTISGEPRQEPPRSPAATATAGMGFNRRVGAPWRLAGPVVLTQGLQGVGDEQARPRRPLRRRGVTCDAAWPRTSVTWAWRHTPSKQSSGIRAVTISTRSARLWQCGRIASRRWLKAASGRLFRCGNESLELPKATCYT
jgi:integrase